MFVFCENSVFASATRFIFSTPCSSRYEKRFVFSVSAAHRRSRYSTISTFERDETESIFTSSARVSCGFIESNEKRRRSRLVAHGARRQRSFFHQRSHLEWPCGKARTRCS